MTGRQINNSKAKQNRQSIKNRLGQRNVNYDGSQWTNTKYRNSVHSRSASNNTFIEIICHINVIIAEKFVRAKIDSGSQMSRIGSEVARAVIQTTGQRARTRVIDNGYGRGIHKILLVRLGTRLGRMRDIECIIDGKIPPRSAVLGMIAIKSLGYQINIGGRQAYQSIRKVGADRKTQPPNKRRQTEREREQGIPFMEEEVLDLEIDTEEARGIENWL